MEDAEISSRAEQQDQRQSLLEIQSFISPGHEAKAARDSRDCFCSDVQLGDTGLNDRKVQTDDPAGKLGEQGEGGSWLVTHKTG